MSILFFNVILQFCYNLDCSKKSSILCKIKKKKLSEHYKSMYIYFLLENIVFFFLVYVWTTIQSTNISKEN